MQRYAAESEKSAKQRRATDDQFKCNFGATAKHKVFKIFIYVSVA